MQLGNSLLVFEDDLAQLSAGTRQSYLARARELVRLLGDSLRVADLTPQHFYKLTRTLKKREYSHSTANTYAVVAGKLLSFWLREGWLAMPPEDVRKVEKALRDMRPKAVLSQPFVPKAADIAALVMAARVNHDRPTPLYQRDIAFIEVLASSGMRIAEISALTVGQIELGRARALIRGKGNRQRYVYFSAHAVAALQTYWKARGGEPHPKDPALASHSDQAGRETLKSVSTAGLRQAFDRLAIRANLPRGITPHKLRHAFASALQHDSHDVHVVQTALGHASLSSTQRYLHTDDDTVEAAVEHMRQGAA